MTCFWFWSLVSQNLTVIGHTWALWPRPLSLKVSRGLSVVTSSKSHKLRYAITYTSFTFYKSMVYLLTKHLVLVSFLWSITHITSPKFLFLTHVRNYQSLTFHRWTLWGHWSLTTVNVWWTTTDPPSPCVGAACAPPSEGSHSSPAIFICINWWSRQSESNQSKTSAGILCFIFRFFLKIVNKS